MSHNSHSKQNKNYDESHKEPLSKHLCGHCSMTFYNLSTLDSHIKECQQDRKDTESSSHASDKENILKKGSSSSQGLHK